MKEKRKNKVKKNSKLRSQNIVLILGIIYALITLLAIVSYVSNMNMISTTPVTIASVLGAVWLQILMIILFVVAYILYSKKPILGILTEIIMGVSMLAYIIVSIFSMGFNILALIIELIYPTILIYHGLLELKKIKNRVKKEK